MEKCKNFNLCGGCSLLNIDYPTQLKQKQSYIQSCLKNENIDFKVEETEGMFYPYKYRNKIHLAVSENKGNTFLGFFEEGSNKIIKVQKCALFDLWAEQLINITNEFIKNFKIIGYNKEKRSGIVRYIVARKLKDSISVCIVATSQNFAGKDWYYKKLVETFKNVSFYLNINKRTDNAVFDDNKFIFKGGLRKIKGKMLGVEFELSPNSFYQTNEKITSKMYEKAVELLNISKNDTIYDLYSGIGITSILFAKHASKVYSIEYSKTATQNAISNAKLNGLKDKIEVSTGMCKDILPKLPKIDNSLCFLDPARSGAEPETLYEIVKLLPKTIVYMSCNAESLAGDLKILLSSKKYKLNYIQGFDMFPQTKHIEVLAQLVRLQ